MDSQIPFFCGDSEKCLNLGNIEAPKLAIRNIEKHFLVVGTLAEMDKTYAVMECLMPEYLSGLVNLNNKQKIQKHSEHKEVVALNSTARMVLEERLQSEYTVYNYVKEKLDRQYRECQKLGLV